jgi:hypothetical protein
MAQRQRVIAGVEELDFGAEQGGGALGLIFAAGFNACQRGAGFLPGELALAALAIGQADDLDLVAAPGVQGDSAAGAPDEIARMGGDDEPALLFRHGNDNSLFLVRCLN